MKNQSGFSIVQVMIAAGLVAGLALVVMQLMKNAGEAQGTITAKTEEIELRSAIRMILEDERFCRVSLAGEGPLGLPVTPVTFKKSSIDEATEGLDVELYLSNQVGDKRTQKKFSAAPPENQYGKLKIKSIKLRMNNETGKDYIESLYHSDVGELDVTIEKKIGNTLRTSSLTFDLKLLMNTNGSGLTTIFGCKDSVSLSAELRNCHTTDWSIEADNSILRCPGSQVMRGTGIRVNGSDEYVRAECCDLLLK